MNAVVPSVVWHDVECGAYGADLALWEELAAASSSVLELGAGSGRVVLHLARRGHRAHGLDLVPELVDALNARAGELPATATVGDARSFELDRLFGAVLAPMQFMQLLRSPAERTACLSCIRSHLEPGGMAAFALTHVTAESAGSSGGGAAPPIPDAQEVDGWIYSSLPIETVVGDEEILVRRLRQTVSPAGDLEERIDDVRLLVLTPDALEREAQIAGLRPAGRRAIPATDLHVGSTVVLLEKEA